MNHFLKIIQSTYFQQLVFWIVSFLSLHAIFTIDYNNGWSDVLFTLLFHIPLFIIVILNIIAIEKTLDKKHFGLYAVYFLSLLFLGWLLFSYGFEIITDLIAPRFYFTLFYSGMEILQFVMSYLIISFLLIMTRNWFMIKEKTSILEREHHQASLNLLKSQINPHFLLNSLNNIYSLSSENPKVRNYLIKLSEGLKYMTYETTEDLVLLDDELNYLDNYVELEKLRLQNSKDVRFLVKGSTEGYLIPPLLLIPFVENCFKHSNRLHPIINININVVDDHLILNAENTMSQEQVTPGGLGVENVKQRLKLLYKEHYELNISKKSNTYKVYLKLNLEKHGL
ncbi:MAG: histidine kinase [Saprospiraceae bacterium]|nr:histidine kinase [Saprospiraceae bacterium]